MTVGGPVEAARTPRIKRLGAGVRGRLLALILAATVPVVGLAIVTASGDYNRAIEAARQDGGALRDTAVARYRAEMDIVADLLLSLAGQIDGPALAPDACGATLRTAQDLFRQRYSNIWILDGDGRLRCSALPVERAIDASQLPSFRAAIGERRPVVSGFAADAASEGVVITSAMPVASPDDGLRAVVVASVFLSHLSDPERAASTGSQHHVWLIDNTAATASLTGAPSAALPDRATLEQIATGAPRTFEGTARSGAGYLWSSSVLLPGLRLLTGFPMDQVRAAARMDLASRLVEPAILLLAAVAVILLGVEVSVSGPLRRLAARVRAWQPGDPFIAMPTNFDPAEVKDLETAMAAGGNAVAERETRLRAALAQRDLAMEEMSHRVHNNLQIVASLLSMQADGARNPDVRAEFAVARDRVRALATLYRHLSRSPELGRVVLRPFIEELCRQLGEVACAAPHENMTMAIEVEDVSLAAEQADSLALLITEAVSNCVQHAFPDRGAGTVAVSLHRDGEAIRLTIRDDGVGLPAEAESGVSLGLKLIRGFATQLGGTATFHGGPGTEVRVSFPLSREQTPRS